MIVGFIYLRANEYWDTYSVYKLGKTVSIPDREQTYITGELKRGHYITVIEVEQNELGNVEIQLQEQFTDLHVKFNAGREFYKKEIVSLILPYFENSQINYRVLSADEINSLTRIERAQCGPPKYIQRDYQRDIVQLTCRHFITNTRGILVIPCGVGKTLISLWISIAVDANTILIGVPNKLLLTQWEDVISSIFPNVPRFVVSGGVSIQSIERFLTDNYVKCIILTTYSSAHKVYTASDNQSHIFDIVINDEAHHLTAQNISLFDNPKTFIQMLNIPCAKRLSLTATLKQIDNDELVENFGEIIDRKCMLWAINLNIICDYVVQTIVSDEHQLSEQLLIFNVSGENDTRLFLGAYIALRSVFDGHSHHLLVYTNNMENSVKLETYMKMLIIANYFSMPNLYHSVYHGDMKQKHKEAILDNYNNSTFGIIVCVYCLGEGYDNCQIDGTVFAENMSSNVRIVQSAQRACRKDVNRPDKIAKIIIPIFGDWDNPNNSDLKKVREIVYQMGLEDVTVMQKIKVSKLDIIKSNRAHPRGHCEAADFGEYVAELTQQLLLKTTPRISLGLSYQKAKTIIAKHSLFSKEAYYEFCEQDNRFPKEPDIIFGGDFTNWIDYLSIPLIYYDIKTCITKVGEYLSLYPAIRSKYMELPTICKELCIMDSNFPPSCLWAEYYNVNDLRDIIVPVVKKKKKGLII